MAKLPLIPVFLALVVVGVFGTEKIEHGKYYYIQNVAYGFYLTAYGHGLRQQYGLDIGKVYLETLKYQPSQMFEAIQWTRDSTVKNYWLLAAQNPLNEISLQPNKATKVAYPLKNIIEFHPIKGTDKFQIFSETTGLCIEGQGLERPIVYSKCDKTNEAQHFIASYVRNKQTVKEILEEQGYYR